MNRCNEANLEHARETVEQFGECWLHGDGNVYHTEAASKFQRTFSNPNNMHAKSWAHFRSVAQIPETPEELLPIFMGNRVKDEQDAGKEQNKNTNEPVVIKSKKLPPVIAKISTEDLLKTAAGLTEKESFLSSREDILDQTEIQLEQKNKSLAKMEARLKQMEQDLATREAALKKKEAPIK